MQVRWTKESEAKTGSSAVHDEPREEESAMPMLVPGTNESNGRGGEDGKDERRVSG